MLFYVDAAHSVRRYPGEVFAGVAVKQIYHNNYAFESGSLKVVFLASVSTVSYLCQSWRPI
jgi:hypothetical protein